MEDTAHREGGRNVIREFQTLEMLNPQTRMEHFMRMDGDEIDLPVTNTSSEGETISKEMFVILKDLMTTWVGTRLMRRMNEGKQAKRFTVTVGVKMEDE